MKKRKVKLKNLPKFSGGGLPKYSEGGTAQPIYVSDPNDPRLKSYQDSLTAYQNNEKFFKEFLNVAKNAKTWDEIVERRKELDKKYPRNNVAPIKEYKFEDAPILYRREDLKYTAKKNLQFKNPTQPIIYRPERTKEQTIQLDSLETKSFEPSPTANIQLRPAKEIKPEEKPYVMAFPKWGAERYKRDEKGMMQQSTLWKFRNEEEFKEMQEYLKSQRITPASGTLGHNYGSLRFTQAAPEFKYGGQLPKYNFGGIPPEVEEPTTYTEDEYMKEALLPPINIEDKLAPGLLPKDAVLQNIDKLIIDDPKSLSSKFKNIHVNSKKNCLAGALNCNQQYLFDEVFNHSIPAQPIRTQIANREAEYEEENGRGSHRSKSSYGLLANYTIPSSDYRGGWKHGHAYNNESIDSWEMASLLVGEGLAKEINFDIKKGKLQGELAVGDLIFLKRDQNYYTGTDDPTHTITVVGFDKKGNPLMYDYGEIVTLDKLTNNYTASSIGNIVRMNSYDKLNMTYNNLQNKKKSLEDRETYKGKFLRASDNIPKKYSKSINKLIDNLEEVSGGISSYYGLEPEVITKLSQRLIGIGIQETGLGKEVDLHDMSIGRKTQLTLGDNSLGAAAKGLAKVGISTGKKIKDGTLDLIKGKEEDYKADWRIEKDLFLEKGLTKESYEQLSSEEKEQFKQEYLIRKSEVKSPSLSYKGSFKDSAGSFKVKDLPRYAQVKDIKKKDLRGLFGETEKKLEKGSEVALGLMAENYRKLALTNPDLSIDDLIDLTTVAYNNYSKSVDKDFIDFYIRNKNLPDSYLNKVKTFEKYAFKGEHYKEALDKQGSGYKKYNEISGLEKPNEVLPKKEFGGRIKINVTPYQKIKEQNSKPKTLEYPSIQPKLNELLKKLEK